MRGGSLLVVGIVPFFVLYLAVIGFVTVKALKSRACLASVDLPHYAPRGASVHAQNTTPPCTDFRI